ncbi:flavin-containing monooxygenase [Streptomyces sp. NPDC057486]|uniref:flavin-containing monooxygenase n=1 Tax=Streptomyces sp. NPDC057486 TaxID=3346145 RepID=UPI00368B6166
MAERAEVIVIGGGQTGLVTAYYLARAGIPYLVLDGESRVGDAWRNRWDSLELFTIAQYCELPGLRFPGRRGRFPDKNEMADYLEEFARTNRIEVRLRTEVTALDKRPGGGFLIETNQGSFEAEHVVIATGAQRLGNVPPVSKKVGAEVFQVHTGDYRNPKQIPGSRVVVVGAANSGAQIATELAKTHRVTLSQGSPLPHFGRRFLGIGIHWWGDKLGIIKKPLIGERDRLHKKTLLVGPSLKTLSKRHRFTLAGRTVGAEGRTIRFEEGTETEVDAVVWATGFRYDFSWIGFPALDEHGVPLQDRGVTGEPGMYFLGLQCQFSYGSGLIWWVKDDARYVVNHLDDRRRARSGKTVG